MCPLKAPATCVTRSLDPPTPGAPLPPPLRSPARSPDRDRGAQVAHAARLLALFGWALKCEARSEDAPFRAIASVLNPRSHGWILERKHWAASVLLRLRAVVGTLRKENLLSSDSFKFVEERLAKLSAVDATCTRLATLYAHRARRGLVRRLTRASVG